MSASTLAAPAAAPLPTAATPPRSRAIWLIAPALVLLGVFLLLPYLNIVLMSLRPPAVGAPYGAGLTLGNYTRALTDGYLLGVLGDTLLLGRESSGVPEAVHAAADARLCIPLIAGARSLNMAQAAAMAQDKAHSTHREITMRPKFMAAVCRMLRHTASGSAP